MSANSGEPNPSSLRLLILAPQPTTTSTTPPFPSFLHALTGSKPSSIQTTFAGYTSHPPLRLSTKYYRSDVNIWCDELPANSQTKPTSDPESSSGELVDPDLDTLDGWKEQMLSAAAAEVRAVIGGIVLLLPVASISSPSTTTSSSPSDELVALVESVHALREAVEDENYGRDIAATVVLQGMTSSVRMDKLDETREMLEDACLSDRGILGWDFVSWNAESDLEKIHEKDAPRNEYGERTGIARVIEVLEGVDWSASPNLGDGDDDGEIDFANGDGDSDSGLDSFNLTKVPGAGRMAGLDAELQREMMELKLSMTDASDEAGQTGELQDDQEDQVDQFPALMERVVAIREAGSEMSPSEREKFARREVARIMREMS
ncbi:hypothetical protein PV10_04468 [Exophiala mesophila]|uniref:Increased recombination centers protein 6 n=1 Tax=Exophiala mesophila TaxID=212818 RepID=A0A0D1ZHE3_EXOME|nr:uncharacterized protein PV10_04468 [Exophiala mesophila]KIV93239.1 hypothetical protein PV10_04468 [Exophiala mesophila]